MQKSTDDLGALGANLEEYVFNLIYNMLMT